MFLTLLGVILATVALAHWRPRQTAATVGHAIRVPMVILHELADGLACAAAFVHRLWRENFEHGFSLRALLGGAFKLAVAALATVADIELVRLSFETAFGGGLPTPTLPLLGQQSFAALLAYTFAGIGLLLADGFLEFAGTASFHTWSLSATSRRICASVCLGLFLVLSLVQGAAAVRRGMEIQDSHQVEATANAVLLGEGGAASAAVPVTEAPKRVKFWDQLPLWIQGAIGTLVPLVAGLAGAFALHAVLIGAGGIGLALPLGILWFLGWFTRAGLNAMAHVGVTLEHALATVGGGSLPVYEPASMLNEDRRPTGATRRSADAGRPDSGET